MLKQQKGFTLIELVIVIVILGILAATAAPKFIDLSTDAQSATLKATEGAIQSAAVISFAQAKAAVTMATILANTDYDINVITVANCGGGGGSNCTLDLVYTSGPTESVSVSSSLCSTACP